LAASFPFLDFEISECGSDTRFGCLQIHHCEVAAIDAIDHANRRK
jgi:hypothetical protein